MTSDSSLIYGRTSFDFEGDDLAGKLRGVKQPTNMASWVHIEKDSDFSLQNLPYGIFSADSSRARIGVAIGEHVLDLNVLAEEGVFEDLDFDVAALQQPTLNAFAALGRRVQSRVRQRLQDLLEDDTHFGSLLRDAKSLRGRALVPISSVQMHLPMVIGDYTDFFVGLHHAATVSVISLALSYLCSDCQYSVQVLSSLGRRLSSSAPASITYQ